MNTLVIGYGNDSRRDDGIGWFVADELAKRRLPNVVVQTMHQLEVELAEQLTGFGRVIFIDASVPESPDAIRCSRVEPNFESHAVAHYLTPPDVLSLCRTLYGHDLEAILFSIRGDDFDFGMFLTPRVEQAGREVVEQIVNRCSANTRPAHTHA